MKIILIVLVVLIGLVLTAALVVGPGALGGMGSFNSTPQGMKVRAKTLKKSSLTEMVKAPGTIEPRKHVQISAEISARVEELPFEDGDRVRKGDVVVRLDDRDLLAVLQASQARRDGEQFRLQSEQARLQGLLSNHEYAKKDLERKQSLYDTGDISSSEYEDATERVHDLASNVEAAKYTLSVIESSLVSAKANIDQAEQQLAKTILIAPMDGVITSLNAEVGEVVLVGTMNNPGTVIMVIADLERMILNAEVSENDVTKVKLGHTSRVYINGFPNEVFSGTVTNISLQRSLTTSGTGYFKTEIEIDLQGQLVRSGHTANADIEVAKHEGLIVPSQAVLDRAIEDLPEALRKDPLIDPRKTVAYVSFKIVDGKAKYAVVQPGPSDLTQQVVLKGLNEGDVVVIGPYKALLEELKDGMAVSIEGEEKQPEKPKAAEAIAADSTKEATTTASSGGDES